MESLRHRGRKKDRVGSIGEVVGKRFNDPGEKIRQLHAAQDFRDEVMKRYSLHVG